MIPYNIITHKNILELINSKLPEEEKIDCNTCKYNCLPYNTCLHCLLQAELRYEKGEPINKLITFDKPTDEDIKYMNKK